VTKEELLKENRVREILEAARRVMARNGMQGTTVDRVAEEAKVDKEKMKRQKRRKRSK